MTTACQVSLDSWERVELFIYKSLWQQHQSNVFNHWYVYFFHGDIELQRVRSDKNSLLWFSFGLLLKSHPYCRVEDYTPSQSPKKHHIFVVWNWRIAFSCTWFSYVLLQLLPILSLFLLYCQATQRLHCQVHVSEFFYPVEFNRAKKPMLEDSAWITLQFHSPGFQN